MSPRIVTFSPAIFSLCSRIVKASSNACVGCSCAPSPALMMLALTTRDRKCGAPDALCRMTMKSILSASRLRAVSLSVSPFLNDDDSAEKFTMSAVSRCAASSKLMRVRVDGSTKKLMTVLPRSAGTFLMARSPTALNARAVSSTVRISSTVSDSMSSKCFLVQVILFSLQNHFIFFADARVNLFIRSRRHIFADEIRLDGQFAMAAINQHRQLNFLWPAKIIQRIHRRARGAAAEQNIVHEHNRFAAYVERNFRWVNFWRGAAVQIVAVHGNVETADRNILFPDFRKNFSEPLCERHAAGGNPDEHDFGAVLVALGDFMRDARERALNRVGVEDDVRFRHKKARTVSACARN